MSIGLRAQAGLGPVRGGHRWATTATFAASGPEFKATGAMIVHRLPYTAGMRQGSRDRQTHGKESAHERENEQQSGGQAVHGWLVARQMFGKVRQKPIIGYGGPRCKSPPAALDYLSCSLEKTGPFDAA
jgi:hypothetical protein